MSTRDQPFEVVKEERRKWYYTVGSVQSKYLNEPVKFNKHGFWHALVDGRGKYRGKKDALMRLHLLPRAPLVVKNSVHLVSSPAEDPRNKLGKSVTFFEFQHVVKTGSSKRPKYTDITVILRRIGNGGIHYYSIRYTKHGYKEPQ